MLAVFLLMLVGGFAELLTLGAVFPLLAVLAAPAGEAGGSRVGRLLSGIGIDIDQFSVLWLGAVFCLAIIAAASVRLLLAWASQKFVYRVGYDLGVSLYERMLYQPYSFHVSTNSSRLISDVKNIQAVLSNMMPNLMQAISGLIISIFILSALILVDPVVAVAAFAGLGSIYAGVSLWSRPRLRRNSKVISANNKQRLQAMQEGLGGIRDVLLDNRQAVYVKKFERIDRALRDAQAANALIGVTPRFVVEALGMVLIVSLALVLRAKGSIQDSLPVLAVFALAAQRLMPLLQGMYQGWTSVTGNQAVFLSIVETLQLPIPARFDAESSKARLPLTKEIRMHALTFRYAESGPDVLSDINLVIPQGSRVGFIGQSGSGKSTLMDLLMGLLQPTGGAILVDGKPLTETTILAWQREVAHVPQHIFLSDGSITENVAFGIAPNKVDHARVSDACRKAELEEFVESLPDRYDSIVGERGVKLSGGQRQRIGVARALYKQAPVLVLDEATSALDDATEASIIEAVNRLGDDYTVIMIAHRLTTLRQCDTIFRLDRGVVAEAGTFAEIISGHESSNFARPAVGA